MEEAKASGEIPDQAALEQLLKDSDSNETVVNETFHKLEDVSK